jgi:hypothetical protein
MCCTGNNESNKVLRKNRIYANQLEYFEVISSAMSYDFPFFCLYGLVAGA